MRTTILLDFAFFGSKFPCAAVIASKALYSKIIEFIFQANLNYSLELWPANDMRVCLKWR